MIYRRFGRTGLPMPVLSYGCMRSMHSWQDSRLQEVPNSAQEQLRAILISALTHGITHIETAYDYGTSERQLGALLPLFSRSDYILQTKVVPSEDPEDFVAKVKISMQRLGVKRLDLLALHGINDHRTLWYSCRKNGCLAAARELQQQRLVDHIGFSGHGTTEVILQALRHEEDGGFDFCNIHWYYIFDLNREAIELAADKDIGIFIISPSDKGGHLHTPSRQLRTLCSPLSPMLFNDLYCLRQKGVCTIGIGAAKPEDFDEHLLTLDYLASKDLAIVDTIDKRLREAMFETTGQERPDYHWNKLPPWEQAPGNINMRMVIWLYNLSKAWGMQNYGRTRYAMLNTGSSWVPGNDGALAGRLDFSSLEKDSGFTAEQLKKVLLEADETLRKRS